MEEKKYLEELIVDQSELVHKVLKDTLKPLLGLSKDQDVIIPTAEFQKLSYKQKVTAYLLARLAMADLGIPGGNAAADVSKIAEATMINKSRCSETLSRMRGELFESGQEGWFIPKNKISLASNILLGIEKP